MKNMRVVAERLIAKAQNFEGIDAGIADLAAVLEGPSYKAVPNGNWQALYSEKALQWIPEARSLLVLAMYHPENSPELDWFHRGNTPGNRQLARISRSLAAWLSSEHGMHAQPLPYHQDGGGVFLKDAAVLAGLGIVGKNNLLIHRKWGPQVRLRSILIRENLLFAKPPEGFAPCAACARPCLAVCPEAAFKAGSYHRPACIRQMNADQSNPMPGLELDSKGMPVLVTKWCRLCELACPIGG